jgi:nicotinate-nucleotide adenylyltransferase
VHTAIARAAADHLELDEVFLVPAAQNPLKKRHDSSPARDRLAMTRLVLQEDPRFALCDLEIARGGHSYTAETLFELQAVRPGEYWLILGGDSLRTFADWRSPERIARLARLAVILRPPHSEQDLLSRVPERYHDRIDFVPFAPEELSSTEIRDRIRRNRQLFQDVSPEVLAYAKRHRLYEM